MRHPEFLGMAQCRGLRSGYLVTLNLQHLYECRGNEALRAAIFDDPKARLCVDGRGAKIVLERLLARGLPRAAGNELLETILADARGGRVLVVGSQEDVLREVRARFPAVEFHHDGSRIPPMTSADAELVAARIARQFGRRFSLVTVALGVPKQEILARALARHYHAPILCIGGSFEMLAGRLPRAPRLLQRVGLEALWRATIEPTRARLRRLVYSYWFFARFVVQPREVRRLIGDGPAPLPERPLRAPPALREKPLLGAPPPPADSSTYA